MSPEFDAGFGVDMSSIAVQDVVLVVGGPDPMFSSPSSAATPVGADITIDLLRVIGSI